MLTLGACEHAPGFDACRFSLGPGQACTAEPPNRVAVENCLPGAEDWWVPYNRWSQDHEIEGYTDQPSYAVGDTVLVSASSIIHARASWRLLRAGWYGGVGAREIEHGSFAVAEQPLPPASTWDVPCRPRWPVTFAIALPLDLVSGIYILRLDAGSDVSFNTFVVREDDRIADLVYQRSDFTDAMYNNWDGTTNRSSWYGDHPEWVSLDRVQRSPSGSLYPYSGGFFTYEVSMVRFLERQGYDTTYISDYDTHVDPHALDRGRAFLSVGHDEYWTAEMRDEVEYARNAGTHLAFFGADACDGILRISPDDPHLISVTNADATPGSVKRLSWQDLPLKPEGAPHDNPNDTLTGSHYGGWCGTTDNRCLDVPFAKLLLTYAPTVEDPTHPVFRDVALRDDHLPPIIGYEYEVRAHDLQLPPNVHRLADVPAIVEIIDGPPLMLAYQASSGARVFNAGSMHFNHGLDAWAGCSVFRRRQAACPCDPSDGDCFDSESVAVQQLTVNLLADMGAFRHSPDGPLVDTPTCDWSAPAAACTAR